MKRLRVKRVSEIALVDKGDNPEARIVIQKRVDDVEKATKAEGGQNFPAKDYAYVPDAEKPSTWKLRVTSEPGGKPDAKIVGMAMAAVGPQGFRGNKAEIPAAAMPGVKAKLRSAYKACHPDMKPEDMPAVLKSAAGLAWAVSALGLQPAEMAKQLGVDPQTFDEVRRFGESWDASDEIMEYAGDLANAIRTAVQAGDEASAKQSIAQFAALLEGKLPDYFGQSVEKGEGDVPETTEKAGRWAGFIKWLKAMPEDVQAAVTADPPADPPDTEEPVADEINKAEVEALRKRAEEAEAKVQAAEAEKAEAVAKAAALEVQKREAEAVAKAATWDHLSIPEGFGKVLRKIRDGEKLETAEVAQVEQVLDGANTVAKTGKVFAEIGHSGQSGNAFEKVQAAAAEYKKADPKLTDEQARAKVYTAHPEYVAEVEKETAALRAAH